MLLIAFNEFECTVVPKVLMVANDGHLYKEGLPANYDRGTQ